VPNANAPQMLQEYKMEFPLDEAEIQSMNDAEKELGYPARNLEHAKQVLSVSPGVVTTLSFREIGN